MRVRAVAAMTLLATGCHMGFLGAVAGSAFDQGPYLPRTLADELGSPSVRTLGCLDVGLDVRGTRGGETLDVHVGNRCGHPERFDLKKLAVHAVDESGREREVTLRDPRSEVVIRHVGGAEHGRERFRLDVEGGLSPLRRMCFDLGSVAPDSREARPAPLCFDRDDTAWRAGA
jgi:hypothetical protein